MGSSPSFAQSQKTDIRPQANRIIGKALVKEFSGITHDGAYNFSDDGEPRRFYTETTQDNGRTLYIEDESPSAGNWMIIRDTLCFIYDNDSLSGGCFRVYKVGNCFYYYSDTLKEYVGELDRDYWTARSVKDGDIPTCEPSIS